MMYIPLHWLLYGLAAVNGFAALLTLWDKWMARRQKRRVPESTLLWVAVLGGSVAMLPVMLLIRHKTKHLKFMVGLPIILLLQVALVYFLWRLGCFPR